MNEATGDVVVSTELDLALIKAKIIPTGIAGGALHIYEAHGHATGICIFILFIFALCDRLTGWLSD